MAEGDDDAIEFCLSCIYNCTLVPELLRSFQTEKHRIHHRNHENLQRYKSG